MAYSITPQLIMAAARKRGWQVSEIEPARSFYSLTLPDGRYYYVSNITTRLSSAVNNILAERKDLFTELCQRLNISQPATLVYVDDLRAALSFVDQHGQIVVKPVNQAHGNGITVNVSNHGELQTAIERAQRFSQRLILQQQVAGDDYRLLFINKKLAAAAIRKPAFVKGDGARTVRSLIMAENTGDGRTEGYGKTLMKIDMSAVEIYLGSSLDNVPAVGEEVQVIGTANIGQGGVALDVTDTIDRRLVDLGQRIIDHFDIGLCGVDIIYDGTQPYVIEINTRPSLGLHEYPYTGQPRQTPEAFLDWLAQPAA